MNNIKSPAKANRYETENNGSTSPTWNVITYHVEPQINEGVIKRIKFFKVAEVKNSATRRENKSFDMEYFLT